MGSSLRERNVRYKKQIRKLRAADHRCFCDLCAPHNRDKQDFASLLKMKEYLDED
jgi:hypothetical protein